MRSLLLFIVLSVAGAVPWDEVDFEDGYKHKGSMISPWHDVDFYAGVDPLDELSKLLAFVCEIPRDTVEKMEIHKTKEWNPIIQDTFKDGSPRYYKYGPSLVNYGAIPQTWEDPSMPDVSTSAEIKITFRDDFIFIF